MQGVRPRVRPTLGRFISVDPVRDLADPQQWNAYTYANGNPVTFSAPSGLKTDRDEEERYENAPPPPPKQPGPPVCHSASRPGAWFPFKQPFGPSAWSF